MPARPKTLAFIGLGSNLDNPKAHILRAKDDLNALADTELVSFSGLYRSRAQGPVQPDFINAAAALTTALSPDELLTALQAIEAAHKRQRVQHWGPRTLDLDLLLYGEQTIATADLKVPHPLLEQRCFVLGPLNDIAPDLVLPNGRSIASLWRSCDASTLAPLQKYD